MIQTFRQYYQQYNTRRRTYIVPSRFGFVYVGFLLLMLLGAINYSNSMGHLLVFLLASLGIVSMNHTNRNLAKLNIKHIHAKPVFCGQTAKFNVVFDNPSRYSCHQLAIANKQKQARSWNPFKRLSGYHHRQILPLITARQNASTVIALITENRGKMALGSLQLSSTFPLGIFYCWSYFHTDYEVLVYPKPEGLIPLPKTTGISHKQAQQHLKGLDDFAGFNSYRRGDPIHSIAWKALARDDVMRTKQFSSPQDGRLVLTWQETHELKEIEKRLSQLCLWILQAEAADTSYSLIMPTTTINYGHGDSHRRQCLTLLALYQHE